MLTPAAAQRKELMSEPKDVPVTLRMSAEEKSMLEAVAAARGISNSDVIRLAIRAEHAKLGKRRARG